jgi:energy-coupling factor transporter ATP-binding protein EcfA2
VAETPNNARPAPGRHPQILPAAAKASGSPARHRPDAATRRVRRPDRPLRFRQKHPAQPDRPARPPDGGQLFIDGEETSTLDEPSITRLRGQRIGFVFQHHHLIPAFTAEENVMMPLLVARGRPDAAMRQRAAELLAEVGLADRRTTWPAASPAASSNASPSPARWR